MGSCHENGSNHINRNLNMIATNGEEYLESTLRCLRDGSLGCNSAISYMENIQSPGYT